MQNSTAVAQSCVAAMIGFVEYFHIHSSPLLLAPCPASTAASSARGLCFEENSTAVAQSYVAAMLGIVECFHVDSSLALLVPCPAPPGASTARGFINR